MTPDQQFYAAIFAIAATIVTAIITSMMTAALAWIGVRKELAKEAVIRANVDAVRAASDLKVSGEIEAIGESVKATEHSYNSALDEFKASMEKRIEQEKKILNAVHAEAISAYRLVAEEAITKAVERGRELEREEQVRTKAAVTADREVNRGDQGEPKE